jgi:hypothetical protein
MSTLSEMRCCADSYLGFFREHQARACMLRLAVGCVRKHIENSQNSEASCMEFAERKQRLIETIYDRLFLPQQFVIRRVPRRNETYEPENRRKTRSRRRVCKMTVERYVKNSPELLY